MLFALATLFEKFSSLFPCFSERRRGKRSACLFARSASCARDAFHLLTVLIALLKYLQKSLRLLTSFLQKSKEKKSKSSSTDDKVYVHAMNLCSARNGFTVFWPCEKCLKLASDPYCYLQAATAAEGWGPRQSSPAFHT